MKDHVVGQTTKVGYIAKKMEMTEQGWENILEEEIIVREITFEAVLQQTFFDQLNRMTPHHT